jgi:hypothetical protein
VVAGGASGTVTKSCPAGTPVATGGGWQADDGSVHGSSSWPVGSDTAVSPGGWQVTVSNTDSGVGSTHHFTVYVICAA